MSTEGPTADIPSLQELCLNAMRSHPHVFRTVKAPFHLVHEALRNYSADDLAHVEKTSPHIAEDPRSDSLWRAHVLMAFPALRGELATGSAQEPTSWRDLYRTRMDELARKEELVGQRLRLATQAARRREEGARTVQLDRPLLLPTKKKRKVSTLHASLKKALGARTFNGIVREVRNDPSVDVVQYAPRRAAHSGAECSVEGYLERRRSAIERAKQLNSSTRASTTSTSTTGPNLYLSTRKNIRSARQTNFSTRLRDDSTGRTILTSYDMPAITSRWRGHNGTINTAIPSHSAVATRGSSSRGSEVVNTNTNTNRTGTGTYDRSNSVRRKKP